MFRTAAYVRAGIKLGVCERKTADKLQTGLFFHIGNIFRLFLCFFPDSSGGEQSRPTSFFTYDKILYDFFSLLNEHSAICLDDMK